MKNPQLFKNGEAFIASMGELIRRYDAAMAEGITKREYEAAHGFQCLLCNPLHVEENHKLYFIGRSCTFRDACGMLGCPWLVILGITCDEFCRRPGAIYNILVYDTDNPRIIKNRIRQLKNWIKIYKRHLAEIGANI